MPDPIRPVLVVAAMRSELRPFSRTEAARTVHTAVTGIGTERATRATLQQLDEHPDIERVVMIGIAGGVGPLVGIGDLVVPETVIDARTGVELHPDPIGDHRRRHTMHTSDDFVSDPATLAALAERGVVALDMESAAVGVVCAERGIVWSVLRGISDHVEHLPVDPAVLRLTGPEGEPRPAAVARYLLRNPTRVATLGRLARGAKEAIDVSTEALVASLG